VEPYVPLRNATKRKRLRIGYICRNHSMIYMSGVNSNFECLFYILKVKGTNTMLHKKKTAAVARE
jgi:hypothetical protein